MPLLNGYVRSSSRSVQLTLHVTTTSLAGHGGNAGGQVVGNILQQQLDPKDAAKIFTKELAVAAIVGVAMSTVAAYVRTEILGLRVETRIY